MSSIDSFNIEDLSTYRRDSRFYGTLDLLLTVKSFDLQAIRKRYLASRGNKSGAAGSVERRAPSTGGVARIQIRSGNLAQADVIARMKEPRGIDVFNSGESGIAIAAENELHWNTAAGHGTLRHPWFAYLHTVQFHPSDVNRVVVSSSGFDYFAEFSLPEGREIFQWLAWENGHDEGHNPETGQSVILTRDPERALQLQASGREVLLVSDPPEEAIPTARRAAFINSVCYRLDGPDEFLATFFHKGMVMAIDRKGISRPVITGLKNPHGGRTYRGGFLATSTASGEIVWRQSDLETRFQLSALPGKDAALGEWEWVQNSLCSDSLILAIDSNRTCFVIFDPEKKLLDMVPYDPDWAVQDGAWAPPSPMHDEWLSSLNIRST